MTLDWTNWLQLSQEERDELLRRYRATVRQESDAARHSDYRAMDAAIWAATLRSVA